MNQPYDVRLEDLDNMSLYTLAMVFYMYGLTPTHNPITVRNMLGEMPSDHVSNFTLQKFLLDQGFTLHHIRAFDRERFIREGRLFLMDLYGSEWTGQLYEYWTDERVAEYQAVCQHEMNVLADYGTQWTQDVRHPEFSDVLELVAAKRLVLSTHDGGMQWIRLSWETYGQDSVCTFEARQADNRVPSIGTWDGTAMFVGWVYSEGILAISRP